MLTFAIARSSIYLIYFKYLLMLAKPRKKYSTDMKS